MNLVRSMLIDSGLPKRLWAEGIFHAAHVLNCTKIHEETGKTPFELIRGSKPFIKRILPFGTNCKYYNRDPNRKKLDDRSYPGVIVGCDEDRRAYRVWIPGSSQIIRTKDVKVDKSNLLYDETEDTNRENPVQEEGQLRVKRLRPARAQLRLVSEETTLG